MPEFIIIRNALKTQFPRVFDMIEVDAFKNPSEKQKTMLSEICDGIEIIEAADNKKAKTTMKQGDYLYKVVNKQTQLVCVSLRNKKSK